MIDSFIAWSKKASKWLAIFGAIGLTLTMLLPLAWKSAVQSVPSVDGGEWYENRFGDWLSYKKITHCKVEWGDKMGWCEVGILKAGTYRIRPLYESWTAVLAGGENFIKVPPAGIPIEGTWGGEKWFIDAHRQHAPAGEYGRFGMLVARVGKSAAFPVLGGSDPIEFQVKDGDGDARLEVSVSLRPVPEAHDALGGEDGLPFVIERRGKPQNK